MRGGDVGSGLKDKSNGQACGSEGRWRSGLTSSLDKARGYPAVERRGARVVAKPSRIEF
jgi:hypothetical protein